MPRKRKGAAPKVMEVDVKDEKTEDIGNGPKAKRGRSDKGQKEVETPVMEEKPKRGRTAKAAAKENVNVKKKQKTVKSAAGAKKTDVKEVVSEEQPKRRSRSSSVVEKLEASSVKSENSSKRNSKQKEIKPLKEKMEATKEKAKTRKSAAKKALTQEKTSISSKVVVEDTEKNDAGKVISDIQAKRRTRSASVAERSKTKNENDSSSNIDEKKENSKPSAEEMKASKEKAKAAKLKATEKAKAAKLVAKEKANIAKLKAKEKAKAAKLKAKEKANAAKLKAKMKTKNKKTMKNRRQWMRIETVFEFTIHLDETRIWRKFQVLSTFTFAELHSTIQSCMGWLNCHMHKFRIPHPKTQKIEEIGSKFANIGLDQPDVLLEHEVKIADYFTEENRHAEYLYDFGDDWLHLITFQKILPMERKAVYPRCVDGKLACPPEDTGGIPGYYNFLEIIKNPKHPEYEEMKEWIDTVYDVAYPSYDPDHFDPKEVMFEFEYRI